MVPHLPLTLVFVAGRQASCGKPNWTRDCAKKKKNLINVFISESQVGASEYHGSSQGVSSFWPSFVSESIGGLHFWRENLRGQHLWICCRNLSVSFWFLGLTLGPEQWRERMSPASHLRCTQTPIWPRRQWQPCSASLLLKSSYMCSVCSGPWSQRTFLLLLPPPSCCSQPARKGVGR